jgi:hypothetical protein
MNPREVKLKGIHMETHEIQVTETQGQRES